MCFSAAASFAVGTYLLGVGTLTLKQPRRPRELAFAAIPLLFAVQQLSEGILWLTFEPPIPWLNEAMTQVYSFMSHVLWPIYVPIAVLLIEPPGPRRQALLALVGIGVAVGAFLLYHLVDYPVSSRLTGQHIQYVVPPHFLATASTLYLVSTTLSLMLSTHPIAKVFGALTLLSFAVAYGFYTTWFISVWCFFAALLSTAVFFHFLPRRTLRGSFP